MNKWKALLAAMILAAGLTACSGAADETEPAGETNAPVDTVETEANETETKKERETFSEAERMEIYNHTSVALETEDTSLFVNGQNPYYNKDTGEFVFVIDREVSYDDVYAYSVIAMGSGDLIDEKGIMTTDDYPALCTENGYRGAAFKLDSKLAPGTYNFNINFSYYNVVFEFTVE